MADKTLITTTTSEGNIVAVPLSHELAPILRTYTKDCPLSPGARVTFRVNIPLSFIRETANLSFVDPALPVFMSRCITRWENINHEVTGAPLPQPHNDPTAFDGLAMDIAWWIQVNLLVAVQESVSAERNPKMPASN